jgi:hypothetical protein
VNRLRLLLAISLATPVAADTVVYDRDNGQMVRMWSGDVLVVKLLVPHGADGWQVSRMDYGIFLGPVISIEGSASVSGTDFQVFRFRAAGTGHTTLELRYVRSLERGYNPPLRIYRLQVIVSP